MKYTIVTAAAALILAGISSGHEKDRANAPMDSAGRRTVEHVQATVGMFGYRTNQQFLFTQGPALVGRDLHFTLVYSGHRSGNFLLMVSSDARPDGPFVSFLGGPPSQVLIGPVRTMLGPFAHNGVQSDFTVSIPQNPALLGRTWCAQALVTGGFVDLSSGVGGVIGNHR